MLHQLVALFSFFFGLKVAAYIVAFGIVVTYVSGSYRFAKIFTINDEAAGYASLVAVILPSVVEAFHVFGQLPMMLGISLLLQSLPEIFSYVRYGKIRYFLNGISLIAAGLCSHHVTPIFGMVFFVVPLMATAVMDACNDKTGDYKKITLWLFIVTAIKHLKRIVTFGVATIFTAAFVIFPYWYYSKSDPISQVPIPHGSRDSFFEVFSSGLVFFIIPWGYLLALMPFFFYRYLSRRNIFIGMSFTLLSILGTGGTTPVTKMILGDNAFNILTLERFTFWATIYAMPLAGEFLWRFTKGDIYSIIISRHKKIVHSFYIGFLICCFFISAGFTMNFSFFRPLQPEPIELKPILNFLKSDKHYKWRFLTLGFGDQMAWLSANTDALTIDGNYHSARRVPELTTRAVERLENSKYRGVDGIGTLHQFLTTPEKFHLKYIFANDKFYDPLLYFCGWHRVKLLDNGIMIWERSDVSTLPAILPSKKIPKYQKVMWGVIPLTCLAMAFFFNAQLHWIHHVMGKNYLRPNYSNPEVGNKITNIRFYLLIKYWIVFVLVMYAWLIVKLYFENSRQITSERAVITYYDALDFKKFDIAHEVLDPDAEVSMDQFLLETSVTDGLVDSYGKLDRIETTILHSTENKATIQVDLEWITPLENHSKTVTHNMVRRGLKWYMKPDKAVHFIPTNQFSTTLSTNYVNQGRRRVTVEETFHEDVLDRPIVWVSEAKLVNRNRDYYVIGLIQNLDDYPADLTIKATISDSVDIPITSYYEKYHLVHKLMPREVTPFRIDFEDVKWKLPDVDGEPQEAPQLIDSMTPCFFKLEILSSVATQDLYKKVIVQNAKVENNSLVGSLYNYGESTATITQMVQSYYDEDKNLDWVQMSLTLKSAFPKKSVPFEVELDEDSKIFIIDSNNSDRVFINGIKNEQVFEKYKSFRGKERVGFVQYKGDRYLRVHLNNYIGSATRF